MWTIRELGELVGNWKTVKRPSIGLGAGYLSLLFAHASRNDILKQMIYHKLPSQLILVG